MTPVDKLLEWAFRQELPKTPRVPEGPSPFRAGRGFDLPVDEPNRWGVLPDILAGSEPHPDAVIIGETVMELDRALDVGFPDGWSPIEDLAGLGQLGLAAVARAVREVAPGGCFARAHQLLISRAVLGADRDGWRCEGARVEPVRLNGKPQWEREEEVQVGEDAWGRPLFERRVVDGYNRRAKRPYADARLRQHLVPDPHLAIVARIEWELWWQAMTLVAERCQSRLAIAPPSVPPRPWMGNETPRVLDVSHCPIVQIHRGKLVSWDGRWREVRAPKPRRAAAPV